MKRPVAIFCAAAIIVIAGACKPSVGSDCKENATSCESPTSRLACVTGHYVAETCKGPNGCKEAKGTTVCDATHGDQGDPCASANTIVCSVDGKTALRCDSGKLLTIARCSKDGCTVNDTGVAHCNDPYDKVGDACKYDSNKTERGNGACNEDFVSELRCKDGKMAQTHVCRGEQGCTPLSTGPWCDRSIGAVGDDCDPNTPEFSVACNMATKNASILTCKNGKLTDNVACLGDGHCYIRTYGQDGFSHYQAACDQSLGNPGDACLKENEPACQQDLSARLVCQMGKFVVDMPCKKGCLVRAPDGTPSICKEKAEAAITAKP